MASASRIGAIDMWRGLVLIAILVDHVPGNGLENVTPRNYGFSDSAEAFVFLSGLSVGAIYAPRAMKDGVASMARACFKRALKLYGVHLALTCAALAMFLGVYWWTGLADVIEAHGRGLILEAPAQAASAIALLSHQIGYFNILPLYIALMLWAPAAVALTLARPHAALIASATLYVAARVFDLHLPSWPIAGRWFFNPLTWQFIFTMGVFAATRWRSAPPRLTPFRTAVCVTVLLSTAFLVTDGFGASIGLHEPARAWLDLGKQNLGLGRLVHFAAIAYLATAASAPFEQRLGSLASALKSLGRHSLPVFAFGSLYCAAGQAAMTVVGAYHSAEVVQAFGFVYTLAGLVASLLLAHRLDCKTPLLQSFAGLHLPRRLASFSR